MVEETCLVLSAGPAAQGSGHCVDDDRGRYFNIGTTEHLCQVFQEGQPKSQATLVLPASQRMDTADISVASGAGPGIRPPMRVTRLAAQTPNSPALVLICL